MINEDLFSAMERVAKGTNGMVKSGEKHASKRASSDMASIVRQRPLTKKVTSCVMCRIFLIFKKWLNLI